MFTINKDLSGVPPIYNCSWKRFANNEEYFDSETVLKFLRRHGLDNSIHVFVLCGTTTENIFRSG